MGRNQRTVESSQIESVAALELRFGSGRGETPFPVTPIVDLPGQIVKRGRVLSVHHPMDGGEQLEPEWRLKALDEVGNALEIIAGCGVLDRLEELSGIATGLAPR